MAATEALDVLIDEIETVRRRLRNAIDKVEAEDRDKAAARLPAGGVAPIAWTRALAEKMSISPRPRACASQPVRLRHRSPRGGPRIPP